MIQESNVKATLERFNADGFMALKGFICGSELSDLMDHVDRFIREIIPGMPAEHVFYEDKHDSRSLKQIQQMGEYDSWFDHLLRRGTCIEVAELLLGGPVVPKNLQYFNKPPGVGMPTPAHQDGHYFMLHPCEAVTMWLSLDQVDEENGCVRYVRGSHKLGLREHARTQTLGFSQGIVDYPSPEDSEQEIAMVAAPGDLLVHQAMTIHRADGNRSDTRTRRALGLIYYSERAKQDEKSHRAYQEKLTEEMRQQRKI